VGVRPRRLSSRARADPQAAAELRALLDELDPAPDAQAKGADEVADRLAELPAVHAVALGGSRAQGAHRTDNDWDLAVYCHGTDFDPAHLRFDVAADSPHNGPWQLDRSRSVQAALLFRVRNESTR